jgi:hypothetical protein
MPSQSIAAAIEQGRMFGIIIADLLTPTAATSAAKAAAGAGAIKAAAATRAAEAAAAPTPAERPLLSERPALRTALRELSRLSSTAHITKGTAWALGTSKALAGADRPLDCPARTADTASPAGPTDAADTAGPPYPADTSNTTSSAGSAYPADTSNTASPAGPTDAADTAGPPYPADTSNTTSSAGSAYPADTSNTANSTGPAHTTDTANPAGSAYPANTADAGRGLHDATWYRHLRTAGQSDGAAGCAREVCRPVAREVCLESVRRDLPAVHIDVVPTVDVYVGVTPAPRGSRPTPQPADHRGTGSESKPGGQCGTKIIAGRWSSVIRRIGRIGPIAINRCGIVARHIDGIGLGRLDDYHLLLRPGLAAGRWGATASLDCHFLCADDLLRRGFQMAASLRPLTKALYRGEHVGLLCRERVAELLQPRQVVV